MDLAYLFSAIALKKRSTQHRYSYRYSTQLLGFCPVTKSQQQPAHLHKMQRALPGHDVGVAVLFRHRSKYSLRGYPLLRCNASLHHVVQEPGVGSDAISLPKNTHHRAKSERVGVSVFLVQKTIKSDKENCCGWIHPPGWLVLVQKSLVALWCTIPSDLRCSKPKG